ncbi:hypothetical protein ElyMa_002707700 [Elysia marginata]|uniref:Uncharacterized protein n=1 Tax=Elysia marginata TaxID=1093978 RepID=A0AAV4HDD3_9GAST|nr:hypothetical protein ElyMa_002707700 [Elysia marginata]
MVRLVGIAWTPEDPDPQQLGSVRKISRCQEEGHLTGTAKMDESDVNRKGGLKRRQQLSRKTATQYTQDTFSTRCQDVQ